LRPQFSPASHGFPLALSIMAGKVLASVAYPVKRQA
jgi:hypothetical protein